MISGQIAAAIITERLNENTSKIVLNTIEP